ncbi:MAG: sulfotransferase family 2 domain-containing protein [Chloroflexota bacterium]
MIVSHRYRYVFVEVPHTGSTAIRKELVQHYGGEDILRRHSSYRDFSRSAPPEQLDYFVFAGVRNPLDLAVTRYFRMKTQARGVMSDPEWLAKHGSVVQKREYRIERWVEATGADFERFLLRWYRLPFDSWTSLDQRRYSTVLRFESLAEDFAGALRLMGIEPVRPLPAANVTPERESDYVKYYTPRAIRRAVWVFGPYMEQWGYPFPPEWGEVRVPGWSRLLMRATRAVRSVYWNQFRYRKRLRPDQLSESPFA